MAEQKRRAAGHEAGHATVAGVFCWKHGKGKAADIDPSEHGVLIGLVTVDLDRHEPGGPTQEETWVGTTTMKAVDLDEMERAVVQVAGMVADYLDDNRSATAQEIIENWKDGMIELPETDQDGIPESWADRETVVERALFMLRIHQLEFVGIRKKLIEYEYLTNHRLEDLVNGLSLWPKGTTPPAWPSGGKPTGRTSNRAGDG